MEIPCSITEGVIKMIPSLKLTFSPLKIGRAPKGNNRIPTIHFQVRTVSSREGKVCLKASMEILPWYASTRVSPSTWQRWCDNQTNHSWLGDTCNENNVMPIQIKTWTHIDSSCLGLSKSSKSVVFNMQLPDRLFRLYIIMASSFYWTGFIHSIFIGKIVVSLGPLIINPIYTWYSGYWLGTVYPLSKGSNQQGGLNS